MQTILKGLTRLTNTPNGNPRWMVHTSEGSFRTEPDSQCASLLSEAMVGQVLDLTFSNHHTITALAVAA